MADYAPGVLVCLLVATWIHADATWWWIPSSKEGLSWRTGKLEVIRSNIITSQVEICEMLASKGQLLVRVAVVSFVKL